MEELIAAEMAIDILRTIQAVAPSPELRNPQAMLDDELSFLTELEEAAARGEVGESVSLMASRALREIPGLDIVPGLEADLVRDGWPSIFEEDYNAWVDAGNTGSIEDYLSTVPLRPQFRDYLEGKVRDYMEGARPELWGIMEELGLEEEANRDMLNFSSGGPRTELANAIFSFMGDEGMKYHKIGQLANLVAVSPRTIRYYEEIGLLNSIRRLEGGKRVYTDQDYQRLKFIKRLKHLGLTLAEMQELEDMYQIHRTNRKVLPRLLELLENHVEKIEERIRNLKKLRSEILTYHERITAKLHKRT